MSKVIEISKKLSWGLALLSSISCLIRNDINIIFAFLTLIILNNYYDNNPKVFSRIIIQVWSVLILSDLIWFFVMWSYWGQTLENNYWKGKSALQTFALITCWIELILKGFMCFYLYLNYKEKHQENTNDLLSLNYNLGQRNEKEVKKGEDFSNPY